jgi:hypothetical protein
MGRSVVKRESTPSSERPCGSRSPAGCRSARPTQSSPRASRRRVGAAPRRRESSGGRRPPRSSGQCAVPRMRFDELLGSGSASPRVMPIGCSRAPAALCRPGLDLGCLPAACVDPWRARATCVGRVAACRLREALETLVRERVPPCSADGRRARLLAIGRDLGIPDWQPCTSCASRARPAPVWGHRTARCGGISRGRRDGGGALRGEPRL